MGASVEAVCGLYSTSSNRRLCYQFVAKYGLLAQALKTLPVGSAYAVWTGIGAAGTAIVGMIWLGESRDVVKIVSRVLLLAGIVGLRLTSTH